MGTGITMSMKDKMLWWFVKNIIMPRNEIIDIPGFIVLRISDKTRKVNLREILLPENLISEFEKNIIKKYGFFGKQLLYSIGKKFGYRFALVSNYPKVNNEDAFSHFSYFLVRYLESIYAKKLEHFIDFKDKIFTIKAKNWIVCSKNGLGYMLFDGVGAGMLSYAFNDVSMEGVQIKCQGRGDENCELVCAPPEYFRNKKIQFLMEKECSNFEFNAFKYNKINAIRNVHYASNSFRKIIDAGFVKYSEGTINIKDERLLLIEASIMYILENDLKKVKKGLDVLWDVSFEWGVKFAEKAGKQDPAKFIMDFFPALGFGDIYVTKRPWKVFVNYFPWTELAEGCDLVMFRGMLSGIISGMEGRKVELKKIRKSSSYADGFSFSVGEQI